MKTSNQTCRSFGTSRKALLSALTLAIGAAWVVPAPALAQTATVVKGVVAATSHVSATPAADGVKTDFASVGPAMELTVGKSTLMRMPSAVERISVGNPNIADVTLISPVELYLLGKNYGSTNLVVWRKGGAAMAIDVNVNIDAARMERKLRELLPQETGIRVSPAANSVILSGVVSGAMQAKAAEDIANAFVRDINKNLVLPVTAGDEKTKGGTAITTSVSTGGETAAKVVNLLRVAQGQQVMLEVKVAEVSKTLLDKLGASLNVTGGVGMSYGILSNFLSQGAGKFSIRSSNGNMLTLDAEKKDGLIKVLAEPNIISISGQEASFLAGGKIFIPVARTDNANGTTVTLEEKEFGVGLKFTPTVLEGGRIHLKVAPEVSELSQTGSPFVTAGGYSAILPSVTTRRVQTTVQLIDGQSLAIAGLIRNNVTESVKGMPLLGDIPVLGALFRSSEFQSDRTELMFLITPRLVRPMDSPTALPTDGFVPPTPKEFFLERKLEGEAREGGSPAKPDAAPVPAGGFELGK